MAIAESLQLATAVINLYNAASRQAPKIPVIRRWSTGAQRILPTMRIDVEVFLDSGDLWIENRTFGELELYFRVVNFTGKVMTVEDASVEYWTYEGYTMPEPTRTAGTKETEIGQHGRVRSKMRLQEKEIATILGGVPPRQNEKVCRRVLLDVRLQYRIGVKQQAPRNFRLDQQIVQARIGFDPS